MKTLTHIVVMTSMLLSIQTITPSIHKIYISTSNNALRGSLNVICGSMCSGKSEELIRQIRRFIIAGMEVLIFKPAIDTAQRANINVDPLSCISSRSGSWLKSFAANNVDEIKQHINSSTARIIAIDEVMFFTSEKQELITLIKALVNAGKIVLIAGLELDFRGEPFGPMPELLAMADNVMKLTAICSVCNNDTYCLNQRLVNGQPAHYDDPLIVVDSAVGSNHYEPRCRACHKIRTEKRTTSNE